MPLPNDTFKTNLITPMEVMATTFVIVMQTRYYYVSGGFAYHEMVTQAKEIIHAKQFGDYQEASTMKNILCKQGHTCEVKDLCSYCRNIPRKMIII